jgi:hypothetical protein
MSDDKRRIHLINVVSIKGGVGKSVVSLGLAAWIARTQDKIDRVLYLDTDFSGTCTRAGFSEGVFDSSFCRDGEYHYIEDLIRSVGTEQFYKHPKTLFERFSRDQHGKEERKQEKALQEKLWLAFSAKDHRAARDLAVFLEIERQVGLILHRLLSLVKHALSPNDKNSVVIVDNGPGIYGLAQSLLEPSPGKDLKSFVKDRGIFGENDELTTTHLFVTTPDRQDFNGTALLLGEFVAKPLDYFVLFNCCRLHPTKEVLEQYLSKWRDSEEFKDLVEFNKRSHAIGELDWLRLFAESEDSLLQVWDRWEKDLENKLGRVFNQILPPGFRKDTP